MRVPTFRIDDEDELPDLDGHAGAVLVTGRALASAARRTWLLWCGAVLVGAVLGVGVLQILPRPVAATATLLMVSPNPDDASAMTTDVTLLQTRAVAARVVADLGLRESPEQFLSSVTATPVSSQVLEVDVSAETSADAILRTTSLIDNFLTFRAEQLGSISEGLVNGYTKRVTALQSEIGALTRQYRRLSAQATPDQVLLNDVVSRRAALVAEVTELQRSIEDAQLRADAAISATHVLDEAGTDGARSRRELVLAPAAGAVVGGALALGTILLRTLTSDRLRQRREVASALGVPVRVGVGRVRAQWWPRLRGALGSRREVLLGPRHAGPGRWGSRRSGHLEALVHGLAEALPPRLSTVLHPDGSPGLPSGASPSASPKATPKATRTSGSGPGPTTRRRSRPCTLGVVAIDRPNVAADCLKTLAGWLAADGVRVLLVDLSSSGALARRVRRGSRGRGRGGAGSPSLHRPTGNPALTSGPRGRAASALGGQGQAKELQDLWDAADLVLVLLEVDPGIDLGVVATWVTEVVPLVSAGRASRDLLGTVTALLTRNGVHIPFALLEGADRTDRTLGHPDDAADELLTEKVASSR
ncbi:MULTISPECIES: hypothetical protein [unclassified Knoellia]|uniref:hypothetical protein n=1 Tax=Knoellia altitudinis TaxID=3404795 RepID=UPI003606030C